MSDQKISELTKITGANLANADEFVVVDVSADQTKAVTREEFFLSVPAITATGAITVSKASGYGSVEVGGPSGAFLDLKSPASDDYDARIIYNDGLNLQITTLSASEPILLRQGGSTKLETSSTGVDVTGNADVSGKITADDLLIDSAGSAGIAFKPDGVTHTTFFARDSDDNFGIYDARNSRTWFRHIGHATTASQSLELLAGGGTLEISGNVGIGTSTPDAELTVAGDAHLQATSGYSNLYFNGVTDISARYASIRKNYDSPFDLTINASSSTSGAPLIFNSSSAVEAMRIDSSGNVGIGSSAPAAMLYVGGNTTILGGTAGNDINLLTLHADTSNNDLLQFTSERLTTGTDWTTAAHRIQRKVDASLMGYMQFGNFTSDLITFGENATEYMRIDGGGNVLVGKTTTAVNTQGIQLGNNGRFYATSDGNESAVFNRKTTNGTAIALRKENVTVGTISVTGSATAYNTSSDYRLKENVTPIQGAADTVMAMQPCTYTAIADGVWYDGFLAHELQEVHPRAVTGTKDAMMDEEYEVTPEVYEDVVTPAVDAVAATYDDEGIELTPAVEAAPETTESVLVTEAVMGTRSVPDMQSVDYSKLTPILTAALQEALTKIDALETRITALEG